MTALPPDVPCTPLKVAQLFPPSVDLWASWPCGYLAASWITRRTELLPVFTASTLEGAAGVV